MEPEGRTCDGAKRIGWARRAARVEGWLRSVVVDNSQHAHNVGVRQQLQRLQLPPQHAVHVLVELFGSRDFALVLDLENAA